MLHYHSIQTALKKLCDWARLNGMGLSIEKCRYLQFGYRNLDIVYRLNSDILIPCDSIVDLGVNVHVKLKSGPHCTAIVFKISTRCRLIVKSFLSKDPFI